MRRSTHALVRCALERNSYDVMKLVDADHGDSPKGGDELLHVCRRMTPPVVCRGRRKSRRRAAAAAAAAIARVAMAFHPQRRRSQATTTLRPRHVVPRGASASRGVPRATRASRDCVTCAVAWGGMTATVKTAG